LNTYISSYYFKTNILVILFRKLPIGVVSYDIYRCNFLMMVWKIKDYPGL